MKVQHITPSGKVINERKVKETEIAPGVKSVDVFDMFNAIYGR